MCWSSLSKEKWWYCEFLPWILICCSFCWNLINHSSRQAFQHHFSSLYISQPPTSLQISDLHSLHQNKLLLTLSLLCFIFYVYLLIKMILRNFAGVLNTPLSLQFLHSLLSPLHLYTGTIYTTFQCSSIVPPSRHIMIYWKTMLLFHHSHILKHPLQTHPILMIFHTFFSLKIFPASTLFLL